MLLENEESDDGVWENHDHLTQKDKYRVVLLGQKESGKTALYNRFISDCYMADYVPTRGAFFSTKAVECPGSGYCDAELELWNIEGSDFIGRFLAACLQSTHAVTLVVDRTRQNSLDVSYKLLKQAHEHFSKLGIKPVYSLVFSKNDLKKDYVFSDKEKASFVEQCDCVIGQPILNYQLSAKENYAVTWFFQALAKEIINKPSNDFVSTVSTDHQLVEYEPQEKKSYLSRNPSILFGGVLFAGSGLAYGLSVFPVLAVVPAVMAMSVSFALAAVGLLVFAIKGMTELVHFTMADNGKSPMILPTMDRI